jgi:tryptophanyl-tRNA synthetase
MESDELNTESGVFVDDNVVLTPWTAQGNFTVEKYQKLIEEFGVEPLTNELIARFEKITGHKPHRLLRRGLFFAHRNFEEILNDYELGKRIFIYTGRGPTSDTLHLGHIVPLEFTVWLQKVFNAFVIFQIADDEKYWFKNMNFEEVYNLGYKNAEDIIALGFDPKKTFIFSNRDRSRTECYQKVAFDIMKKSKIKDIEGIFGLDDTVCIGQMVWPIYQTTAAFSEAFEDIFGKDAKLKCLVACAIDQDPYFRLARDVARMLDYNKPCSLMCRFLPSLGGNAKMSSTNTLQQTNNISSTIYMNDAPKLVEKKIKKYAFSGGQETLELHKELGGNPDIDVSFQWLRYFMEHDEELEEIEKQYRKGELLTGQLKKIASDVVNQLIRKHQEAKKLVTVDVINEFYQIKKY